MFDTPHITVIRGGRQRAVVSRMPSVQMPRENSRLAALPPADLRPTTATDASPILVLRGVRSTRYAMVSPVEPAQPATHLLTVIRGARPHPRVVRLQAFTQPGPLILRIPD